jgi:hypothetical protein
MSLNLTRSTIHDYYLAYELNTWNYLTISVDYSKINFYINLNFFEGYQLISIFEDNINENFYLSDPFNGFEGFMYSIEVYNQPDTFGDYYSLASPKSQTRLSNCNIDEDPTNNCNACPSTCGYGCSKGRCNLCTDDGCFNCIDYNSCINCKNNSSMAQGLCVCNPGFYWSNSSESCEPCSSSCLTCNEFGCLKCGPRYYLFELTCIKCPYACNACTEVCLECLPNATLTGGSCRCNLGFSGPNCSPYYLHANLSVLSYNSVILNFTDGLINDLSESDISIYTENQNLTWSIKKFKSSLYQINIASQVPYPSSEIVITFVNQIISINNAALDTINLYGLLPECPDYEDYITQDTFEKIYDDVTIYYTSTVISISIILSNPVTLWSSINTIQLLSYSVLSGINYPPITQGSLIGLRSYYIFPNFITFFYKGGIGHNFAREKLMGFKTNSIFTNTGKQLTGFSVFIGYFSFLWVYNKIRPSEKVVKKLGQFKYNFFIRFFIQNYLELTNSILLGIFTMNFESIDQILNGIFSILIMVISK